MTNESLTLFIPLYGKAFMSREGLFPDPMVEKIVSLVDYDFSRVDTSHQLSVCMAVQAAASTHGEPAIHVNWLVNKPDHPTHTLPLV